MLEKLKKRLAKYLPAKISVSTILLILNSLVFLLTAFLSQNLFDIHYKVLIAFGAKSPLHIYSGEIWRLFTATFLHAGPIHFLLNMMALKILGPIIENILGKSLFLFVYIISGFFGNLASSLSTLALSIGASSSIMGLVGVGVALEYLDLYQQGGFKLEKKFFSSFTYKKILRILLPGPFAMMTFLNILIALVFNFVSTYISAISVGIDNAAHLGGLFAGFMITLAWLFSYDNYFVPKKVFITLLLSLKLIGCASGGMYILSQTDFLLKKMEKKISSKYKHSALTE